MTIGSRHPALLAEYQSLMDEEHTLWKVISRRLAAIADGSASEVPADADFKRWVAVRERRVQLDRAIAALAQPRRTGWGDLVSDVA